MRAELLCFSRDNDSPRHRHQPHSLVTADLGNGWIDLTYLMVGVQNNPLQQADSPPRQLAPLFAQRGPGSGSGAPVPHVPS